LIRNTFPSTTLPISNFSDINIYTPIRFFTVNTLS
jgi:hypothetical protein